MNNYGIIYYTNTTKETEMFFILHLITYTQGTYSNELVLLIS